MYLYAAIGRCCVEVREVYASVSAPIEHLYSPSDRNVSGAVRRLGSPLTDEPNTYHHFDGRSRSQMQRERQCWAMIVFDSKKISIARPSLKGGVHPRRKEGLNDFAALRNQRSCAGVPAALYSRVRGTPGSRAVGCCPGRCRPGAGRQPPPGIRNSPGRRCV